MEEVGSNIQIELGQEEFVMIFCLTGLALSFFLSFFSLLIRYFERLFPFSLTVVGVSDLL